MTVLIDTYDVPAHLLMPELYKCLFYEVMFGEIHERVEASGGGARRYVVLTDINEQVLLAVRDVESVIYVFHREMLTGREYDVLEYYTNELVLVENNHLMILNKKRKKREMFRVIKMPSRKQTTCRLEKVGDLEYTENAPPGGARGQLSDYQRKMREEALPFILAQNNEEVHFPGASDEESEEI